MQGRRKARDRQAHASRVCPPLRRFPELLNNWWPNWVKESVTWPPPPARKLKNVCWFQISFISVPSKLVPRERRKESGYKGSNSNFWPGGGLHFCCVNVCVCVCVCICLFLYLTVPGLSWGTQDLWSSLRHVDLLVVAWDLFIAVSGI